MQAAMNFICDWRYLSTPNPKSEIMESTGSDEFYMRLALAEAEKAAARDEVPVGDVIVAGRRVIARAHNLTETLNDPPAHAEMQAITPAPPFLRRLSQEGPLCP